MGRLKSFFQGCKLELSRLTWPNRAQLVRLTGVVFLVSLLMTVFFGLSDFGLAQLVTKLFS